MFVFTRHYPKFSYPIVPREAERTPGVMRDAPDAFCEKLREGSGLLKGQLVAFREIMSQICVNDNKYQQMKYLEIDSQLSTWS